MTSQQPNVALKALTYNQIIHEPPKTLAGNAFTVLEGFADISPEEQNNLVHQVDEHSFFDCWRHYIGEDTIIGISVAGLVRVKIDNYYIFMKEGNSYVPFGGAFTYGARSDRDFLESLGASGFLEDLGIVDFVRDMRFFFPVNQIDKLEDWLFQQLSCSVNARIERHPVRELREELVDELRVFSATEFEEMLQPRIFSYGTRSGGTDLAFDLMSAQQSSARIESMKLLARQESIEPLSKIGWALEDTAPQDLYFALRFMVPLLLTHPSLRLGLASPYLDTLLRLCPGQWGELSSMRASSDQAKIAYSLKAINVDNPEELAHILINAATARQSIVDEFLEDPTLLRDDDVRIIVAVKRIEAPKQSAFDQISRRTRRDLVGRDTWRPQYDGMVAQFSLHHTELQEDNALCRRAISEPYDILMKESGYIVSAGNGILEVDSLFRTKRVISSDWFAQIHSVDLSRDQETALVASSGFDAVFEIDLSTGEIIWEWFAFERMNSEAISTFQITRSRSHAEILEKRGFGVLLVDNPKRWTGVGIPTRYRAHHPNEARYGLNGQILITTAQAGLCIDVDKVTGNSVPWIAGLQTPHGFSELSSGGRCVADTRRGRILITKADGETDIELDFRRLPGLTAGKRDGDEWIQNVIFIRENILLVVDRGRDRIWLLDLIGKKYRGIRVPAAWRIHRVVPI